MHVATHFQITFIVNCNIRKDLYRYTQKIYFHYITLLDIMNKKAIFRYMEVVMKKNTLVILLIIETTVIILGLILHYAGHFKVTENSQELSDNSYELLSVESADKELFRELSPDGNYTLVITAVGEPSFPFGTDQLKVTLFETVHESEGPRRYYRASFRANVANDGARAEYKVEWLDDGVQIALSGEEQPTAYYVLPFKTLDE